MSVDVTRVAVVISTRNREASLARCLRSLGKGSRRPDEIVVADQSTGPGTQTLVASCEPGLHVRYQRVRDHGLGASQNDGVRATTCPVVAILDDDCVADDEWIAQIAERFAADSTLEFLTGRVLALDDTRPGMHPVSTRTSTTSAALDGDTPPWDAGSGNNFAFRRHLFDRVGGCDERLGPGAPGRGGLDMDLFRRFLRVAARARYEPDVLVLHEQATTADRLARRFPYGYGMGACCMLWLRSGDRGAFGVLRRWVSMRTDRLGRSLVRRRWLAVREECLVLFGTVGGIFFGLTRRRGDM